MCVCIYISTNIYNVYGIDKVTHFVLIIITLF